MNATHDPSQQVQEAPVIRDAALLLVRRPFSVEDYVRMAETGLLRADERTELLDGEVVRQMPISSRHAGCVNQLNRLLVTALLDRAVIGTQNPVRLDARSQPEPDLGVLRPRSDLYRDGHPGPEDILLLVEVADSSIELDQHVKAPLYAAAGVPELWIVDLARDRVEVLRQPGSGGYAERIVHGPGDRLAPSAFPELSIAVDAILGLA